MTLDEIRAARERTMKMSPQEFRDAINGFVHDQIAREQRAADEAALLKLHDELQHRIATHTATSTDIEIEVRARKAIMVDKGMDPQTADEVARTTVAKGTTR